ncbi:MAG TPA: hypothetical protein PK573_05875 [Spirochaetota bacterium]|nr:hypothetical protein [Spirochaetota bacterium]HSA15185.1 hypothetical protein [Spirochaetota bacterium]
MKLTVTKFRQDIYRYLDKVISTGIPIELERGGQIIKVVIEKPKEKLNNLESHNYYEGDYKDIDRIDWDNEWKGYKKL